MSPRLFRMVLSSHVFHTYRKSVISGFCGQNIISGGFSIRGARFRRPFCLARTKNTFFERSCFFENRSFAHKCLSFLYKKLFYRGFLLFDGKKRVVGTFSYIDINTGLFGLEEIAIFSKISRKYQNHKNGNISKILLCPIFIRIIKTCIIIGSTKLAKRISPKLKKKNLSHRENVFFS